MRERYVTPLKGKNRQGVQENGGVMAGMGGCPGVPVWIRELPEKSILCRRWKSKKGNDGSCELIVVWNLLGMETFGSPGR